MNLRIPLDMQFGFLVQQFETQTAGAKFSDLFASAMKSGLSVIHNVKASVDAFAFSMSSF